MVSDSTYLNFRSESSMPQLENGFVYLWALFAVVLAGIVMAGTGQVWQAKSQREKEAELLYIGEEFRKAIMSYYNTGTKQYPESLEDLLQDKRTPAIKRHLRKIYTDPVMNTTEWGIVEEPPPGSTAAANKTAAPGNSPASKNNPTTGNNPTTTSNTPTTTNNTPLPSSTTPNSSSVTTSNISKRIIGVYSLSEKKPIKKNNFPEHIAKFSEALTYQDWQFVYKPGDASSSTKPASTPAKPNATSPTASPFAPQSSSKTNPSPSSPGNASPFAPQSSSPNPNTPSSGFPSQ
jgi:type II secretory pathway pseudopilin PulG